MKKKFPSFNHFIIIINILLNLFIDNVFANDLHKNDDDIIKKQKEIEQINVEILRLKSKKDRLEKDNYYLTNLINKKIFSDNESTIQNRLKEKEQILEELKKTNKEKNIKLEKINELLDKYIEKNKELNDEIVSKKVELGKNEIESKKKIQENDSITKKYNDIEKKYRTLEKDYNSKNEEKALYDNEIETIIKLKEEIYIKLLNIVIEDKFSFQYNEMTDYFVRGDIVYRLAFHDEEQYSLKNDIYIDDDNKIINIILEKNNIFNYTIKNNFYSKFGDSNHNQPLLESDIEIDKYTNELNVIRNKEYYFALKKENEAKDNIIRKLNESFKDIFKKYNYKQIDIINKKAKSAFIGWK